MTDRKHWFISFLEVKSETVIFDDGKSHFVERHGDVQVKLSYGKKSMF